MSQLKWKIKTILPIALAILLPGLSYFTNEQNDLSESNSFYPIWAISSFVIYNIWHLIWNLWDIRKEYKDFRYLAKLLLFFLGSIGVFQLLIQTNFLDFNSYNYTRTSIAFILIAAIQYTLKSQENIARLQLEKEQIQTENYKAKLAALQIKIDPHFLFNSLNTLHSMVRQSHSNSEQFILSLADFYRQTLSINEESTLPLSQELELLDSYLFLMKNRNEGAVKIEMNIDEGALGYHLPTLALQILVENSFKHNSMTLNNPLTISIRNTTKGFIEVKNNIQAKIGTVESTGNGLELLIKRYELMAIDEGVFVEETASHFSVKLKLIQ